MFKFTRVYIRHTPCLACIVDKDYRRYIVILVSVTHNLYFSKMITELIHALRHIDQMQAEIVFFLVTILPL